MKRTIPSDTSTGTCNRQVSYLLQALINKTILCTYSLRKSQHMVHLEPTMEHHEMNTVPEA